MRTTIVVLLVGILALAFAPDLDAKEKETTIDESAIYLGDSGDFDKPGTVDVDKVYRKIPEYREILRLKLKETDAKYLMLMKTATDKFLDAVQTVADEKGYDLIGAKGSIHVEGVQVPDITSYVIAAIPNY